LDCKPHIAQLHTTRSQAWVVKPDFKLKPKLRQYNYIIKRQINQCDDIPGIWTDLFTFWADKVEIYSITEHSHTLTPILTGGI